MGNNKVKISFSPNLVSSLIGIPLRQLYHWDKINLVKPSISKSEGRGSIRLYSFSDIIELKTVAYLKNSEISIKRIAEAISYIKNNYPYNKPLKELTLYSNKKDIIFSDKSPNEVMSNWIAATKHGQIVYEFVVPFGNFVDDINTIVEKYNKRIEQAEIDYKNNELVSFDSIKDKYFGIPSKTSKGCHKKRPA